MAPILSAGSAKEHVQRFSAFPIRIALRARLALGLALLAPASYLMAEGASQAPASQTKTNKPIAAQPPAPAQLQARPTPAPTLTPSLPPVVEWDGKKLTIDAQDSTLTDILLAIRSRTGASVDMPGSASAERVAVHLGPAPIREVLASLLYGTDFDYVIQGSDTDEFGLKSVTLTTRGKGDDSNSIEAPQEAGVRLMPGYAAPGKRTFEVMQEKTTDSTASAADSKPATDSDSASDAAPAAQESASAASDPPASAPAATADSDSQSNSSSTEAADVSAGPVGTPSTISPNTVTSSADASAGGQSSIPQMEQNLQRMYQQRQKIQEQQNQGLQPSGK